MIEWSAKLTQGMGYWQVFWAVGSVNDGLFAQEGNLNARYYPYRQDWLIDDGIGAGAWNYSAAVQDGVSPKTYLNGLLFSSNTSGGSDPTAWTSSYSSHNLYIGGSQWPEGFSGIVDELRVSGTPRSDAWIEATNHSLTDSLVSFGEIESLSGQTVLYVNKYYEKNLDTGEVTTYYYHGARLVVKMADETLTYLHQDHLTGTSVASDEDGDPVNSILYTPYGTTRSGDVPTDKKFTGQRLDGTGLY